jgi:predicted rRNA methylase YqxC with S4 and FtsJ domains
VSYLSVSVAVAQLDRVAIARGASLVALVKPMFELRAATAPSDRSSLDEALAAASAGATAAGWDVRGSMDSPVTGSRGARELLLHAVRS